MTVDDDRAWGRWFLRERCGTDPDDEAAVRDLYETARGWALARGRWSREYRSLVDAVVCVYGRIPVGWPEPFPHRPQHVAPMMR